MPEIRFDIVWPDGTQDRCYSPSTAIRAHLAAGARYSLAEFLGRARTGLHAASRRVEAVYGMPCGRALGELARIEARADAFAACDDAHITILALHE